ncbi:MAG: peptidyl-prolyl cis-trans isomerase [Candidatus Hydrogenedentes bacterium]|nr:peptidyl-prolyl cis-trans isomerase [Candidatus Hydrogenedentota bacterium]
MIRYGLGIALVCCGVAFTAQAQAPDLTKLDVVERAVPDGPVAIVGDSSITKDAFLELYRRLLREFALARGNARIEEKDRIMTGLRSLYGLVQQEILYQEAQKRGISVSQSEIDQAMKDELEELSEHLTKDDGTPLKPGELTEEKVLERAGKTHEQATSDLRRALMIEKVYDQITKDKVGDIAEKELRKAYDDNREQFRRPESVTVKQIFLGPKPNPRDASPKQWAEIEKKMENAVARMRAGESFDAVAKAISERPNDITLTGPIQTMPPFFVERLDKMQPGEMSAPFRSEYGYHIIQLVEMNSGADITFEEAKPRIRSVLLKTAGDNAIADFCQPKMEDPSYVKVFIDLEHALAAESGGAQASAN